MEQEETHDNAALWALFTHARIEAIEARPRRSLAPGAAMHAMRWMLPSIHHGERLRVFESARAAPGAVLEGKRAIARTHRRPAEFAKLEQELAQRAPEATLAS